MAGQLWAQEEIDVLLQHYEKTSCHNIAKILNRTTRSVQHKFAELKLERGKAKVGDIVKGWLIKEIFIMQSGNQKISMAKIESTLGDNQEKIERLTRLTNQQIGWP